MAKLITFIDAGVLITAFRGHDPNLRSRAMQILNDPQRVFAGSDFVQLEVIPKAVYVNNRPEFEFYKYYFAACQYWPDDNDQVIDAAMSEANAYGLNEMDALHVAAAFLVGADELVTIEKPEKSIHRAQSVTIVTIR